MYIINTIANHNITNVNATWFLSALEVFLDFRTSALNIKETNVFLLEPKGCKSVQSERHR